MTERLAKWLSKYFVKIGATKSEDVDIVAFGLFHIIADGTQILILLLIGLFTKAVIEILVFTIFYANIKKYSGGYHLNKHYLCVIAFTSIVCLSLILGNLFSTLLVPYGNIFLSTLTLIIILKKAPIPHPNNPKSKEKLIVFRKKAIVNAIIELFLIIITSLLININCLNVYITSATFGGILASITLLIPINTKSSNKLDIREGGDSNETFKNNNG